MASAICGVTETCKGDCSVIMLAEFPDSIPTLCVLVCAFDNTCATVTLGGPKVGGLSGAAVSLKGSCDGAENGYAHLAPYFGECTYDDAKHLLGETDCTSVGRYVKA